MEYEKLLLPTDGSKASFESAEEGFDLAEALDADVTVVSVVEDALVEDKIYGSPPADVERVRQLASDSAEKLADRARERGLEADEVVKAGDPAEEIVELAEDGGFDLVVMGTHGRGGLDRLLLGSVTDKVVRTSSVPVVTVGSDE
ncbi:MAG: universal stress protein [Halobacteriota archaeon]